MSSIRRSPYAFVVDVARYLGVEPRDVQRMIRQDKLPATSLPAKTRNVSRIPLRDFHIWLRGRTANPAPALADYATFLADFNELARVEARGSEVVALEP